MTLLPLPAFADNYIWMLHDGKNALVVDPGDAAPVLAALAREGVQLQTILVTHHHADHTGGVDALREATGAQVYGPARETIPEPLQRLQQGDTVSALGWTFQVLDVPGHTAGHIAYYRAPHAAPLHGSLPPEGTHSPWGGPAANDAPLLFCGDTLFSAGCGRLFEGTPAQMQASLESLAALPGDTRVCCTHEYTLSNLKFALEVEPDNAILVAHNTRCQTLRAEGQATLPSSIGLEQQINPFLRSQQPTIMASARRFDATGVDQHGVFATLRQWKNQYR